MLKNKLLLAFILICSSVSFLQALEKLEVGKPMPQWIYNKSTKKEKNNIYTNDTHSVQGDKNNNIVWYKRFIKVEGHLGVFKTWGTSTYSHATIVYSEGGNLSNAKNKVCPKVTVKCGEKEMICKNFENLKSLVLSLKSSAHKLEKVEVFYKDGDASKITYKYPPNTTREFMLSIEYGKKL
jgi:hypothetical protein